MGDYPDDPKFRSIFGYLATESIPVDPLSKNSLETQENFRIFINNNQHSSNKADDPQLRVPGTIGSSQKFANIDAPLLVRGIDMFSENDLGQFSDGQIKSKSMQTTTNFKELRKRKDASSIEDIWNPSRSSTLRYKKMSGSKKKRFRNPRELYGYRRWKTPFY